jgi:hypothetical protein
MGLFSFLSEACSVIAEVCVEPFQMPPTSIGQDDHHACNYHQEPEWHNAFGTAADYSVPASSSDPFSF